MQSLIAEIIERFGGREAGSTQERNAQEYLKERLEAFCDRVHLHEFQIPLGAKFESLKLFFSIYYVTLGLFWWDVSIALIIALVNSILFLGHFVLYFDWLDAFWPKGRSSNVIGVVDPESEVKTTLIFAGHVDSAREFIWWYKYKTAGLIFTLASGFLLALIWPVYLGLHLGSSGAEPSSAYIITWVWGFFVLTIPITFSMFFIHGKKVVPGAQDNLSGVALAFEMAKSFSGKDGGDVLKHTRIKAIGFGSEEIGLRGSQAYVRQHLEELQGENALLVNIDTIKDRNELHIVTSEPMILGKYDKSLIEELEHSFSATGTNYKKAAVAFGGTDGVSFLRAGIPALSIIGMSTEDLDPCYHTRLDTLDDLDEQAMYDLKEVLVHFAQYWDKKHH